MSTINEQMVVDNIINLLKRPDKNIYREVPSMGQSVDIVAYDNHSLIFVEAKVKDWRRAIKQCRAHELVADYVFIAIASVTISEAFIKEAELRGYGIIHVDFEEDRTKFVLEPKKNHFVWYAQREVVINKLEGIKSE